MEPTTTYTWSKATAEIAVRVDGTNGHKGAAKYDANGVRIWTGSSITNTPTAEDLAIWDAEAPVKAVEILAAEAKEVATRKAMEDTVIAKYAGTCKVTGRRYAKGTRIKQTYLGWAIASVDVERDQDLSYQMSRRDSIY